MRFCARARWALAILLFAASASARVKTGTYTGDGAPSRNVTGVGFSPIVVIIKGNDTDATDDLTSAVLRSGNMPAGMSKPLKGDQALISAGILSLNADGFTIGGNRRVNAPGIQFHYVAFEASANLALGTYTGNGSSQSVASVGFNPDYLILLQAGTRRAIHHSYHWDRSFSFNSEGAINNTVTSLDPNGFTLGNNNLGNENSQVYYYVAWHEVPGQMRVSWYFGNGDRQPHDHVGVPARIRHGEADRRKQRSVSAVLVHDRRLLHQFQERGPDQPYPGPPGERRSRSETRRW